MRIFTLLFLFLFPFSAFSAFVKPIGTTTIYRGADGITHYADVITKSQSETYGLRYMLRKVPISAATMGKLARTALRGPMGLAITAALTAADWYFNSDTGEVRETDIPSIGQCNEYYQQSFTGTIPPTCTLSKMVTLLDDYFLNVEFGDELVRGFQSSVGPFINPGSYYEGGTATYSFSLEYSSDGGVNWSSYSGEAVIGLQIENTPITDPVIIGDVVDDVALGQNIFDYAASNSQYSDLPTNISQNSIATGTWANDWPELQTDVSTYQQQLQSLDDTAIVDDPLTQAQQQSQLTADSAMITAINNAASAAKSAATSAAAASEAAASIDEKLQPPPPVPASFGDGVGVPTEIINLPSLSTTEIQSSATGTCPPDLEISVLGSTVTVSYQPMCNLATTLHPYFVALGWFLAAFVVFGGYKQEVL